MSTSFAFKPIVTDGLILNLDAANRKSFVSGSTSWFDLSGDRNTGTLTSGPTYDSTNNGITFNGTSNYIQGTTILQPTGQVTISVWYKATGAPSNNDVFGGVIICADPQLDHGFILAHSWSNQQVAFSHIVNDPLYASVPNNQIINVVCTWNGTNRYIYLNGKLIGSQAYSTAIIYPSSGDRNFRIGMWGYSPFSRFFNGTIYNISLYNKYLSASDVLQNYNALKNRYI